MRAAETLHPNLNCHECDGGKLITSLCIVVEARKGKIEVREKKISMHAATEHYQGAQVYKCNLLHTTTVVIITVHRLGFPTD